MSDDVSIRLTRAALSNLPLSGPMSDGGRIPMAMTEYERVVAERDELVRCIRDVVAEYDLPSSIEARLNALVGDGVV